MKKDYLKINTMMLNINKRLYIFLFITLLMSCDNRNEVFKKMAQPPVIGFAQGNTIVSNWVDSVKYSDTTNYFLIGLNVTSPTSKISDLYYTNIGGTGNLSLEGLQIKNGVLPIDFNYLDLKYIPDGLGTSVLQFTGKNYFGLSFTASANLVMFDNLPPVAVLNISQSTTDPNLYLIDGGKSYDKDAKYGGYITTYSFSVNGTIVNTQRSSINFSLSSPGTYPITLMVTDNDGANSTVSQTLTLPQ